MADNSQNTAVATREDARQAHIASRVQQQRERNEMVKAIRNTLWGTAISQQVAGAIANYCLLNRIDAVRHVDVLGGKIYLNAEFYRERGAHLLRDGVIQPLEPDFINVDPRLEKLASEGDEWAKQEVQRRLRLRIKHNAPEAAVATCVYAFRLSESGALVTGVNWCGGGTKQKMIRDKTTGQKKLIDADPIGDLEPTKTAESRAERRAWRKIADVIPEYGSAVKPIEEGVRNALPVAIIEPESEEGKSVASNLGNANDPYRLESGPPQNETRRVEEDEDLALDRELALDDRRPRHTD